MTDEERIEFEALKARVAELEARPSEPQALEAAIKGSALEKVARLELAALPPGWDVEDQEAARRVTITSFRIGYAVALVMLLAFACHSFFGWPR